MASDSFAFLLRSFLFAELLYVFPLWMVSRACSAAAKSPTLKFPCVSKEWLSFARAPFAASSLAVPASSPQPSSFSPEPSASSPAAFGSQERALCLGLSIPAGYPGGPKTK